MCAFRLSFRVSSFTERAVTEQIGGTNASSLNHIDSYCNTQHHCLRLYANRKCNKKYMCVHDIHGKHECIQHECTGMQGNLSLCLSAWFSSFPLFLFSSFPLFLFSSFPLLPFSPVPCFLCSSCRCHEPHIQTGTRTTRYGQRLGRTSHHH